jgi:predicted O-methyltransferase YrrM
MDKNIEIALLIIIAATSFYLVFASRRIGRKLSKNAQRSTKEIAQQTSQIKRELGHLYHQIEALEQLLPALKLTLPLPASRGWAASPDFLLTLSQLTKKKRPKLVVELGSGVSTLVLAKSGAKKIISFDHSNEFGGQTRQLLKDHKVTGAEIRINELEQYSQGYQWYASSSLKGIKNIDLLVIDGPPSAINPYARFPALEHLLPLLSKSATIILDDADREDEKKLAEAFAAALPTHTLKFLPHEKGTAIISL